MIFLKNILSEIRVEPRGYSALDCYELLHKITNKQKHRTSFSVYNFIKEKGYGKLVKSWFKCTPKELNIIYKLLLQFAKENNIKI